MTPDELRKKIEGKKRLKKFTPDVIEFLQDKPGRSLYEKAYLYVNGLKEIPKCPVCGKELKFERYSRPYHKTCSIQCSNRYKESKEKRKKSLLEKYGVVNPMKVKEIKEKAKVTNLKKYGVENPMKNEKIQEKAKQTNIKRYGGVSPLHSPEIKEKYIEAFRKKYGVDNPMFLPKFNKQVHYKLKEKTFEKWKEKDFPAEPLFSIEQFKGIGVNQKLPWKCKKCGNVFEYAIAYGREPLCPICYPKYRSKAEIEIAEFVKSLEFKISINSKSIIPPYEIDIYIPSLKIAIEFNGLHWHSELSGKNRNYHFNKWKKAKEKEIDLIQIFEDEWEFKKEIVKSILKLKLGKIENKIYARKCEIKEINDIRDFLEENHLQGFAPSKIKLGLFYNNELVSVLGLSKSRFNKNIEWEIVRFANKIDTVVIGSFGKLLSFFIKKYNPKSIISYADLRYFNGGVYLKNGFKFKGFTEPNYYYFKDNLLRYSRIKFQKHKLKDLLENFNPELSEWENMQLNGYDRIWDCGNSKWELTNN